MLTDYTGYNPFRDEEGWSLVFLLTLVISINLMVLIKKVTLNTFTFIRRKLQAWNLKRSKKYLDTNTK